MTYKNIVEGIFKARPNRFVAEVEIDGKIHVCHVKNTGRCRELLVENSKVFLEKSDNPSRKTEYDLVAVYKGDMLVNIDSQAPNKVFYEWLQNGNLFGDDVMIYPETIYKNSRFDFYIESEERRIFLEVKGVTLERDGVVLFPDAPTERGTKHVNELIDAKTNGYDTYVCFVIQMDKCLYFTPNAEMDRTFAKALRSAAKQGVGIIALKCKVTRDGLEICDSVDVRLN